MKSLNRIDGQVEWSIKLGILTKIEDDMTIW